VLGVREHKKVHVVGVNGRVEGGPQDVRALLQHTVPSSG